VSDRLLIVNADDFGRSPGVNYGVARAHREGILTSASLMVRWPDAQQACAYARGTSLSVGLHLDLGEWEYRDGEWHARYEATPSATSDVVRAEIAAQLERFEQLMGRPPTHLDSHQHVHREEPTRTELLLVAQRLGVPVRGFTPGIAYSGAFYGQDAQGRPFPGAITAEALIGEIEGLGLGVTELGCHPASHADHETTYGAERVRELATLCDPSVRAALARCGVGLRSFADPDVRAAGPG
jgi:chitin disaccharide deacetylase